MSTLAPLEDPFRYIQPEEYQKYMEYVGRLYAPKRSKIGEAYALRGLGRSGLEAQTRGLAAMEEAGTYSNLLGQLASKRAATEFQKLLSEELVQKRLEIQKRLAQQALWQDLLKTAAQIAIQALLGGFGGTLGGLGGPLAALGKIKIPFIK